MKTLLEQHPKTTNLLCEYYTKAFIDSLNAKGLPKDFVEGAKSFSLNGETLSKLVGTNPRMLFDALDDNGVFVSTNWMQGGWHWRVDNSHQSIISDELFPTRKEVEYKAVEEAFKALEKKLNNVRIPEADSSGSGG
jgi:hypothetical protein